MDFEQILTNLVQGCVDLAWRLVGALVVFLIGNLIIRFVVKKLKNGKWAAKMDPMIRSFVTSLCKIGLYLILAVIVVSILGIETASIIAVIASAGAAIALGLQGSLSHLAGGVMLIIFRPFRIGDYIEVCGLAGTVSEVGIFYTELTTVDNRVCEIPNGTLIGSCVVNYSVKDTRRVDCEFNLALGQDVEFIKKVLMDVVSKEEAVLADPAAFVRMTELAGSLKLTVRVWVKSEDYWNVKFNLTEAVNVAFGENGIKAPHQQVDVHVKND